MVSTKKESPDSIDVLDGEKNVSRAANYESPLIVPVVPKRKKVPLSFGRGGMGNCGFGMVTAKKDDLVWLTDNKK